LKKKRAGCISKSFAVLKEEVHVWLARRIVEICWLFGKKVLKMAGMHSVTCWKP